VPTDPTSRSWTRGEASVASAPAVALFVGCPKQTESPSHVPAPTRVPACRRTASPRVHPSSIRVGPSGPPAMQRRPHTTAGRSPRCPAARAWARPFVSGPSQAVCGRDVPGTGSPEAAARPDRSECAGVRHQHHPRVPANDAGHRRLRRPCEGPGTGRLLGKMGRGRGRRLAPSASNSRPDGVAPALHLEHLRLPIN